MTDCFGLVCTRVRRECGWMLTWEDRPEAVRGPAGTDASDHAVKEEADLFSFGTGQEENASPWTGGRGDRESVRKQQQQAEKQTSQYTFSWDPSSRPHFHHQNPSDRQRLRLFLNFVLLWRPQSGLSEHHPIL